MNAQGCSCAGLWALRLRVYVLVLAQHVPGLAKEALFRAAWSTSCATAEVTSLAGEVYSSALRYSGTGKEQVLCGALPSGVQEDVTHPCASGLFLSLPPSNLVQLRSHPSHRPPFPGAHTAQRLAAVATSAETPRGDAAYGREKELLFYLCLF